MKSYIDLKNKFIEIFSFKKIAMMENNEILYMSHSERNKYRSITYQMAINKSDIFYLDCCIIEGEEVKDYNKDKKDFDNIIKRINKMVKLDKDFTIFDFEDEYENIVNTMYNIRDAIINYKRDMKIHDISEL